MSIFLQRKLHGPNKDRLTCHVYILGLSESEYLKKNTQDDFIKLLTLSGQSAKLIDELSIIY